jgi:magnesium-transporting ATPase (P-type)
MSTSTSSRAAPPGAPDPWAPRSRPAPCSPPGPATRRRFAAIVACQIGTAFAARTTHASLRRIGLTSNPLLLGGIAFEVAFAAAVIYLPVLQTVFGTAALPAWTLALLAPMPILVWGIDETYRTVRRAHGTRSKETPIPLAS